MPKYSVAIIGAGPAGLSAAARAAYYQSQKSDFSYVVLEAFDRPAKTIQKYQKGKLVMAEPGFLSLRSDFSFKRDSRENILSAWQASIEDQGVEIQYNAEVISIKGELGDFFIQLKSGDVIHAEKVVLSVGLEGNPRQLGVEGDNFPIVQYSLDDPEAHKDESIIVVGAGDSAIENALALSKNNSVGILNRRDEFSRAKEGNLSALVKSSSDKNIPLSVFYSTTIKKLYLNENNEYIAVLSTKEAEVELKCDRVICRLGAIPPRNFLESIGVEFPNSAPNAIPDLSSQYESNVAGLYIIGSLGGYPLIKQAMNQGYDVIEYILGNAIKPADYPLLQLQFKLLPYKQDVDELSRLFQRRIPMFKQLNYLQFRELIIESVISVSYGDPQILSEMQVKTRELEKNLENTHPRPRFTQVIPAGTTVLNKNDYSTTFYTIVEGSVTVTDAAGVSTNLGRGEFFGESSLLSGRAQEESIVVNENTVLVGTPRRTMLKLMNSNDGVRKGIDLVYIIRTIQKTIAPKLSTKELASFAANAKLVNYKPGETLYCAGDGGREIYIIRRGSVNLYRQSSGQEMLVAQQQAGSIIGEMALMGNPVRRETASATVYTEAIMLSGDIFFNLIKLDQSKISDLQKTASSHALKYTAMEVRPEKGSVIEFMMDEGVGEATNCFVIAEDLCIGCDNCETACAETHGGISRVNRSEGPSYNGLHIPITCRHCEQPHCMKDCPPDALHRSSNGEVYIDDKCIGCGNCVTSCPYDAIKLAYEPPKKPSLLRWFLFGSGSGPGEVQDYVPTKASIDNGKKAVKCDACSSLSGGPACVNACPTGAAARVSPEEFIRVVELQ